MLLADPVWAPAVHGQFSRKRALSHASTAEDFVLAVKPSHIYFIFFNDSSVFLSFKRYKAMLIHHRAQLSLLLWLLTRTLSTMMLQYYLAFILVIPLSTLIFMSFYFRTLKVWKLECSIEITCGRAWWSIGLFSM